VPEPVGKVGDGGLGWSGASRARGPLTNTAECAGRAAVSQWAANGSLSSVRQAHTGAVVPRKPWLHENDMPTAALWLGQCSMGRMRSGALRIIRPLR